MPGGRLDGGRGGGRGAHVPGDRGRVVDHGAVLDIPLATVLHALVVDGLHRVGAVATEQHEPGDPLGALRNRSVGDLVVEVDDAALRQPDEVVGVEGERDFEEVVRGDAEQLVDRVANHGADGLEVDVHGGDLLIGVGHGADVPGRDPGEGHVQLVGVEVAVRPEYDIAVVREADDRLGLEQLLHPLEQVRSARDLPRQDVGVLVRGQHHELVARHLQKGRPGPLRQLVTGGVVQVHLSFLQNS